MAEDKVLKELLDELRGFRQDLSDKISTWSNNDNMSSKNIVKSYEAEREKFLEPYGGLDGLQERYRKAKEELEKKKKEAEQHHWKPGTKKYNDHIKDATKEVLECGKALNQVGKADEKIKEFKGVKGLAHDADRAVKPVKNLIDGLEGMYRVLEKFNDPWAKASHAASQYAKSVGLAKKGMDALRKSTIDNMVKSHIGINYNVSTDELLKLQENYTKAVGRNVRLSNADQENMAAMRAIIGEGKTTEFASQFENFGLSMSSTAEHMGKMFADASKAGISFEKYSDNVKQNISIAQNYTFKDGLKGLESMAKKATAIKMDMQMVANLAQKVSTVEGAIDVGAKLQVLGGPFAQAADPLGMLNEGLNDIEGLQDRVTRMIGQLGSFDKSTGEVKVSAFNKRRVAAAAEAMGMDYGKLMESVNANARRGEVEKQLSASASASKLDDNMKELIKNNAEFKNGKAGVSINGEWKSIDELGNGDYEALVAETQDQAADVKDIAKNLRSLVDKRQGVIKQRDANQAQLSEKLKIGELEGKLIDVIGQSNFLLKTWITIALANNIINGIRGLAQTVDGAKDIFNFGKSIFSRGKNLFSRGGKTGFKIIGRRIGRGVTKGWQNIVGRTMQPSANMATNAASNVASRAGTRGAIKFLGKGGAKMIGKAAGPLAGVVGGAFTAFDEFGKENNHSTGRKVGATVGSTIGGIAGAAALSWIPVIGPIIGGAVGSWLGKTIGSGFANDKRRAKFKDKYGLGESLKGDYSVKEIKEINKARVTGKISKKLMDKLADRGDTEMFKQIIEVQKANKKENAENNGARKGRISKNIRTAYFNIGTSYFEGELFKKGSEKSISISRGFRENGKSGGWEAVKERSSSNSSNNAVTETQNSGKKDFNVNINGTLKLTSDNGQSVDIIGELRKNPQLLRSLADMISKEISTIDKGTYVSQKTGR
nr:MAG TPA: Protein of unknown function (DUF1269) [Caudoviricetes sp.]